MWQDYLALLADDLVVVLETLESFLEEFDVLVLVVYILDGVSWST